MPLPPCDHDECPPSHCKRVSDRPLCSGSPSVEQWLIEENKQLRIAGCKMAEAALRVVREYDGLHRLMLAVSEWSKAIADEGGRGKTNGEVDPHSAGGGWE